MITIIPPDNRMAIDGVFKTVAMDLPHINAARLDAGKGYIEHRPCNGEWLPPRDMTEDEFRAEFADLISAYATAPDDAPLRADVAPPSDAPSASSADLADALARIQALEGDVLRMALAAQAKLGNGQPV